jgi:hypothetical protein
MDTPMLPKISYDPGELINEISNCVSNVDPKIRSNCLRTLNLMKNGGNFDGCDKIDAMDLLANIWEKIRGEPDIPAEYGFIFEQIADISSMGACPAGRSKRLCQVYNSLVYVSK